MPPNHPPIRYTAITVHIPEDLVDDVQEFFARKKTGRVTLHVDQGRVLAVECASHHRVRTGERIM